MFMKEMQIFFGVIIIILVIAIFKIILIDTPNDVREAREKARIELELKEKEAKEEKQPKKDPLWKNVSRNIYKASEERLIGEAMEAREVFNKTIEKLNIEE